MSVKMLSIILSLMVFILIVELVRREKLTFKYASAWLLLSLAAVFFAIFNQVLFDLSSWLGFQLPSNFIFFSVLCGFVFLSLMLTMFLCQQNDRNDRIAQKIGLLEEKLDELKNKMSRD